MCRPVLRQHRPINGGQPGLYRQMLSTAPIGAVLRRERSDRFSGPDREVCIGLSGQGSGQDRRRHHRSPDQRFHRSVPDMCCPVRRQSYIANAQYVEEN